MPYLFNAHHSTIMFSSCKLQACLYLNCYIAGYNMAATLKGAENECAVLTGTIDPIDASTSEGTGSSKTKSTSAKVIDKGWVKTRSLACTMLDYMKFYYCVYQITFNDRSKMNIVHGKYRNIGYTASMYYACPLSPSSCVVVTGDCEAKEVAFLLVPGTLLIVFL